MRRVSLSLAVSAAVILAGGLTPARGNALQIPRPKIHRAGPIMSCALAPTLSDPQPTGFGTGFYSPLCGFPALSVFPDRPPTLRSIIGSRCTVESFWQSGGRIPGLYTIFDAVERRSSDGEGFMALRWVGAGGAVVVRSIGLEPTAVYHVGGGRGWVVDHRVQVVPCSRKKP
jgi:hypothetical protein